MGTSIEELLQTRYYQPGENSWEDLVERVINHVYRDEPDLYKRADAWDAVYDKAFLPSSPVLMNSGTRYPMLCSCFVLPVDDSIEGIMTSLSRTAYIQKFGGGVGIDFSPIRKEGSHIKSTNGIASGPVSFMGLWNEAMNVIKQGGKRQGAMMGVLRSDHPDLEYFLRAKRVEGRLTNFNLSVAIDGEFWYDGRGKALLKEIASHTWVNGEPGVLFLDNINRKNPYGTPITATNPCGEVPLPPYGACNLGSINLNKALAWDKASGFSIDFDRLRDLVRIGVEFLNHVLDTTWWPFQELADFQNKHRPIGLGVMGLADILALQGLAYSTSKGRDYVHGLFAFIQKEAANASYAFHTTRRNESRMNAVRLAIAPTGTISMLAGASYGIEPYFTFAGTKKVEAGSFTIDEPLVEAVVTNVMHDSLTSEWRSIIRDTGSVQKTGLSPETKAVLRTATEMPWFSHVAMQATIQEYVDSSVSKTINMPNDASVEDVAIALSTAHNYGCKGITIYRTGSRRDEVMVAPDSNECPSGVCEL